MRNEHFSCKLKLGWPAPTQLRSWWIVYFSPSCKMLNVCLGGSKWNPHLWSKVLLAVPWLNWQKGDICTFNYSN